MKRRSVQVVFVLVGLAGLILLSQIVERPADRPGAKAAGIAAAGMELRMLANPPEERPADRSVAKAAGNAAARMEILTVDNPQYYQFSTPVRMPLPEGTPFDAVPSKKSDYLKGYRWGYLDSVNLRLVCRSNFIKESPETQAGWKAGHDAGSRSVQQHQIHDG